MRQINLREYKNQLRSEIKEYRGSLPCEQKAQMDEAVFSNILRMREYKSSGTIFVYVSTDIEVDTRQIIIHALQNGKKVAVPRCIDGTREMLFHYITSFDDLESGTFGVEEPKETCEIAVGSPSDLMLVPALIIDYDGFRIGYGKGYYDRYIAQFTGRLAGLCYNDNFKRQIHRGRFDIPVNVIVTDTGIRTVRRKDFK